MVVLPRIAGPIALGMNPAIRWPTYSTLIGLGAVVWAIVIAGIGYLFGQIIELMLVDVHKYEIFVIGVRRLRVCPLAHRRSSVLRAACWLRRSECNLE